MSERSPHVLVRVACGAVEGLAAFDAPGLMAQFDALDATAATLDAARCAVEDALFALAGPPTDDRLRIDRRFADLALRRDVHRARPGVLARLATRSADGALPASVVARFAAAIEAHARAIASARQAYDEAARRTHQQLRARLEDPLVREGLRLSGRSLADRAERLRRSEPATWRAADRQAAVTVLDYLARAGSKTSPHGVWCATAVGSWGVSLCVRGSARPSRRLARLHVGEARRLAAELPAASAPEDGALLPNPSRWREDAHWAWWRARAADAATGREQHVRARATPLLDALLAQLETAPGPGAGGIERSDLVRWAAERVGQDAAPWIDRLVDAGLLVAAGGIPHLESRPLAWQAARARGAPGPPPAWVETVDRLEAGVDRIAGAPDAAARLHALEAVVTAAAELAAPRTVDHDALVRVDAAAALEATLPHAVGEEIARVLPRYARLFSALYPPSVRLAPYRARFLARHEADQDVPLATLFHGTFDDLGGFSRASFPDPARVAAAGDRPDGDLAGARAAHGRFRRFFAEAAASGAEEITLGEADWDLLAGDAPAPRFSCGVLFQIVPLHGAGARTRVVWNGLFGPGLALSRLAALHAGRPGAGAGPLAAVVREALDALVPSGAVAAEVPYGHAGRTANAGLRPPVFPDEIALPGQTPTPGARTFPLSDLVVRYDSARGRFTLRSRRHGVEVVPVLSSGLSPEGFISFLAAVGQQDAPPLALFPDLDEALPGPVPRVVSGDTVLFRRRWSVPAARAKRTFLTGDRCDRLRGLRRLARELDLPPRVFAATPVSPKPRYVSLESTAFLHVLEELAGGESPLFLREMLPDRDDAWFADADGRHALEFLAHVRA